MMAVFITVYGVLPFEPDFKIFIPVRHISDNGFPFIIYHRQFIFTTGFFEPASAAVFQPAVKGIADVYEEHFRLDMVICPVLWYTLLNYL